MFHIRAIFCLLFLTVCSCRHIGTQCKAGLLLDSYVQDGAKTDQSLLEKEFAGVGVNLLVRVADGDAAEQLRQAHELIASGVKVLVISAVDQNKAAEIVDICKQYGVTVIAYDRLIKKCDLDYYVSFNNIGVGRLQAEFIMENVASPEICIIGGSIHDHSAFMIHAGQSGVLAPFYAQGKVVIRANMFTEHWTEEEGYMLGYTVLQNFPEINAVLAANDNIAGGVARATKELGHGKLVITGMNADSAALERIVSGEQTMTIYKPLQQLAMMTASLAEDICNADLHELSRREFQTVNNGFKNVPSLLVQPLIIDSSNVSVLIGNK